MATPSDNAVANINYLQTILSDSELSQVSKASAEKINKYISSKLENLPASKETQDATDSSMEDMAAQLQNQVEDLNVELQKSRQNIVNLENEIISIKEVRNSVIDEKNKFAALLASNNAEIERCRSKIYELSDKLKIAVDAKCRALERNNEIKSKEFVLHEREKRMEEEKVLINTRISSLTEEIGRLTYELQTASLNNNAKIISLEAKLTEVNNELNTANELISKMGNEKIVLNEQVHDLTKNIVEEKDLENIVTKYDNEIFEKEKICNMYKSMNEEATIKINEMAERINTLEKLVQESANKNNELEVNIVKEKEDIVKEKNEELSILKNDLEKVKQQLKDADSLSIEMALSKLVPNAAVTIKLLKSDMSLTKIYAELHKIAMELTIEKQQNGLLRIEKNKTALELEEHVLYIQKAKKEHGEILENNKKFLVKIDELTGEKNRLNDEITELSNVCKQQDLEKSRLQKDISNLGRQVCYLLCKHNTIEGNPEQNETTDEPTSTLDMENNTLERISKTLVTFGDIKELQSTNQKLLTKVRDLTEKLEKNVQQEELFDKDYYLRKIGELETRIAELTDIQQTQTKFTSSLLRQRSTYKQLYEGYTQGKRLELSEVLATATANMECDEETIPTNVTDEINTIVKTLENNLKTAQTQLDALNKEHNKYKEEKKINDNILYDQLNSSRQEIFKLTSLNSKYCSQAEFDREQMKYREYTIKQLKKHLGFVEKNCQIYDDLNAKYEVELIKLRDEILHAQKELASAEVQVAKYKLECTLKTDRVNRLLKENEILSSNKSLQDILQVNLRIIEASNERKDTEKNIILESRLKDSILKYEAIRKKYEAGEDQLKERERVYETTNARLQEERNAVNTMRNEILELRQNLANRNKSNEELAKKLKIALRPKNNDSSYYLNKNKELEDKLNEKENEITTLNEELHKSNNPEMKQKWENIKMLIKNINDKQFNLKKDCENKIQEYCQKIELIKTNSNKIRSSNLSLKTGETFTPTHLNNLPEEIREELKLTCQKLQEMTEIVDKTEQKFSNEMLLHSEDIKKLTELKEVLFMKDKQLKEITSARDSALKKNEIDKHAWEESVETFKNENKLLLSRFQELSTQNNLLLDQIQSLGSQITCSTSQLSDSCNESNFSNMSVSIGEDTDTITSEKMVKIINILRKEKDLAVAESNTVLAESARLKSQMKIIEKRLENAKIALNNRVDMTTTLSEPPKEKTDLLKKIETLDALTDSNMLIRKERDNLLKKVEALTKSVNTLENNVPLLNEKISELTLKGNTLETENTTLKADLTLWRNKVTVLAGWANKSGPEDWKRLQTEREALAKMLSAEKQTVEKLYGELANLKTASDENSVIVQENTALKEKQKILQEELETLNKDMKKLTDEASKLNSELSSLKDTNQALTEQIKEAKSAAELSKSKEIQIRNIARKYKADYLELEEKMKENINESTLEINSEDKAEQILKLTEDALKLKSELCSLKDTNQALTEQIKEAKSAAELSKSKEIQIRNIARKYKADYLELIEQETEKTNEEAVKKCKVTELQSSLEAETSSVNLESDLDSPITRDDKAKQLINIAESNIEELTEENKALTTNNITLEQNDESETSRKDNEALAQKSKEIESLKALCLKDLQNKLHNQTESASSKGPVEASTDDSLAVKVSGSVQPGPSEADCVSTSQRGAPPPADTPSSSSTSPSQETPATPRPEPAATASAAIRAEQPPEASSGGTSSATTESRPAKRAKLSEPNAGQKKSKQESSQTEDAETPPAARGDEDAGAGSVL